MWKWQKSPGGVCLRQVLEVPQVREQAPEMVLPGRWGWEDDPEPHRGAHALDGEARSCIEATGTVSPSARPRAGAAHSALASHLRNGPDLAF